MGEIDNKQTMTEQQCREPSARKPRMKGTGAGKGREIQGRVSVGSSSVHSNWSSERGVL